MKKRLFIGVDVGGTKIAGALVNANGKILARAKHPTPPKAKPRAVLNKIREVIDEVLNEGEGNKNEIGAIGIGIPGLVDAEGRKILRTPNIQLAQFPLVPELKKTFRVPVILGNDVNLGILGEQWLGAGRNHKNIVGIFPGTGVGGGIISEGKILTGHQGLAAEIGHMILAAKGPRCHCGNRGCLEALVSRWAIEREIRQAIRDGEKSVVTKLTGGHLQMIKSKTLKKALKSHDPLVTRTLRHVAETLGVACVSLNHLLNPELIILGGGVVEACGDFMLPIVQRVVSQDPFFRKIGTSRIVTATLEDDAVVLGAVALAKAHAAGHVTVSANVRRSRRGRKLR